MSLELVPGPDEGTDLPAVAGMLEVVSTCRVSPVLVGRAEHLSALADGLAAARRGDPAAILVGGEAGIGKSRLVSEFARQAGGDVRVLVGGCLELGASGLPFAPFTAVLRQLARDLGIDRVSELVAGEAGRELARLLPELGQPASNSSEAYQGEARARLFEQMLALFERLGTAGPVALIIEDAHWADRSTRDLLTFLIGNQRVLRGVLIIVTFRSDEMHRGHPLRPLLAELGRTGWVERLELPRLTRQEAGAQIAAILARDPDLAQADRVFARSEGNPLFVEQLLWCDGDLPQSTRDLVLGNVQRLPEETTDLLRVASAGGVRVGHALLAEVSGASEDELARAIRPAVAGNVLTADADGYQFRHALICEAMHDDLLPGEHSRLHARYAEAISADPALVPAGRAAIEVAHHWHAAHDVTWALISAWEAAAQAGAALAYAEQLDMLARVLELWDSVPDAEQRIGTDHVQVLEQAVSATRLAGEDDRGMAFASAALRELDVAAEPARAALLLERRALLRCLRDPEIGIADLHKALELVSDGQHERERGNVLATLAHLRHKARSDVDAGAMAEEALALARAAGDLSTQASALITLAVVEFDRICVGQDSALEMLAEARTAASQAGDYDHMMIATINESHLLEGMGEHARAAEVAGAGLTEATRYGLSRTAGAVLAINQAEPLAALGRWAEASDVIRVALELHCPALSRSGLWQLAGEIALASGDLAAASEALAAAEAPLSGVAYRDQHHLPVARLRINLLVADGQVSAALAAAENALDVHDLQASPRYAWPLLVAAARLAADVVSLPPAVVARGDVDRAVALLRALRAQAAKLGSLGPVMAAHQLAFAAEAGRFEHAVPGEASQAGQSGQAGADGPPDRVRLWQEAAAAWEALSELYPLAGALFRVGEAALADGADRDVAVQALQRAAALAADLGAPRLLDEITLLARRGRIFLADGGAAGTAGAAGAAAGSNGQDSSGDGAAAVLTTLTQRESEVLRLVAAGMTNAAIAGELFISAKTVSVHVSNILGKLGVSSRGEAAAMAHRLRLFDGSPAA
jgi:DNA-binding CsgD family transcriptional regulator/tetratricopeptide (TPR) repeat protein